MIFKDLKESTRYVIPLLLVETFIFLFFIVDSISFAANQDLRYEYYNSFSDGVSSFALRVFILILNLPSHALFIRFLFKLNKPSWKPLLLCLPFSIISVIITLIFQLYSNTFHSLLYICIGAVCTIVLQMMVSIQWIREQVILL
jgi:energy-converting hydrogenase Eha subunit E